MSRTASEELRIRKEVMQEKASIDSRNRNSAYHASENLAKKKFEWQREAKAELSEQQIIGQIELTRLEHELEPEKLQRQYTQSAKIMNLEVQKYISEQHVLHFQELAEHKSLALWSTFEKLIPTALDFKHKQEKERLDSELRIQEEEKKAELQNKIKTHETDEEIREFEAKEKIKVIMDLYRQKLGLGDDKISDEKIEEILSTVQAFNAREFSENKN
jgi:hypothetical protein